MKPIALISLRDRKNNHTSRLAIALKQLKQPKYLSQLAQNIKFFWIATPATPILCFYSRV
ncbi:MAG: hypothetical protein ACYTX0_34760 [Nostoc sp.]